MGGLRFHQFIRNEKMFGETWLDIINIAWFWVMLLLGRFYFLA